MRDPGLTIHRPFSSRGVLVFGIGIMTASGDPETFGFIEYRRWRPWRRVRFVTYRPSDFNTPAGIYVQKLLGTAGFRQFIRNEAKAYRIAARSAESGDGIFFG